MQPFIPPSISTVPLSFFGEISHDILLKSARSLSNFDGLMQGSRRSDLFWVTWLLQEARISSGIEGIETTLDEVLSAQQLNTPHSSNTREVINYYDTSQQGADLLSNNRPFNLHLVRSLHASLLSGMRGSDRNPGEWRKKQVHIGKAGSNIEDALYVPPPPSLLQEKMEDWERFLNRNDIDPLIQAAVMHAQFEIIHPFGDGNGRLGRLLISLFMLEKKLLFKPYFYLSAYLHRYREDYYANLKHISSSGQWHVWINFFLQAVINRSEENATLLSDMITLYDSMKQHVTIGVKSQQSIPILDFIFKFPLFSTTKMIDELKLSPQVTHALLKRMEDAGILRIYKRGSGRRASLWIFPNLMAILNRETNR